MHSTYTAAPTNDIRAYINELPSTITPSGSPDCVSPLIPPFRDDEDDIGLENASESTSAFSVSRTPIELKAHDAFRIHMRMIQCQTYLMRCEVLQSTVIAIERRPWTQPSEVLVPRYYRRIRSHATRAYQLAEAISSRNLQARSRYWSGRGCGGLCDWEAAISHFADAVKLDVPKNTSRDSSCRQSGLLSVEKEDVEFLLQSVTQRYREWIQKKEKLHDTVDDKKENPSSVEDIESEALKGTRWRPDHDRMVYLAKQQSSTNIRSNKLPFRLRSSGYEGTLFSKEDMAFLEDRLNLNDDKEGIRDTFSAEEWRYVLRGDQITKKRIDTTERNSASHYNSVSTRQERQRGKSPRVSPSASLSNPWKHSPLEVSGNLSNSLHTTGYESGGATPSLIGSTRSPSSERKDETPPLPAADRQGRRNVKLPPINTNKILKGDQLGEDVLGSFLPGDSVAGKHQSEAEMASTNRIHCIGGQYETGSLDNLRSGNSEGAILSTSTGET